VVHGCVDAWVVHGCVDAWVVHECVDAWVVHGCGVKIGGIVRNYETMGRGSEAVSKESGSCE